MLRAVMFATLVCVLAVAQQTPRAPDAVAQQQAMKKLAFLAGEWSGEGRMLRASGDWIDFTQTEHAEYKLDGLLLVIQGLGRAKGDGRMVVQAYGVVSYDDATCRYHMRAFNEGRWLESDLALAENGKQLTWGFTIGDMHTSSTLRLTDAGEWTENHEIKIGAQAPKKFMQITVAPVHPK